MFYFKYKPFLSLFCSLFIYLCIVDVLSSAALFLFYSILFDRLPLSFCCCSLSRYFLLAFQSSNIFYTFNAQRWTRSDVWCVYKAVVRNQNIKICASAWKSMDGIEVICGSNERLKRKKSGRNQENRKTQRNYVNLLSYTHTHAPASAALSTILKCVYIWFHSILFLFSHAHIN